MPKIDLIKLEDIPGSSSPHAGHVIVRELTDRLREALRTNQAICLRLTEADRPARFAQLLRAAADELGVVVLITSGELRSRTNRAGRDIMEASVLYARITKAAAKPTQNGAGPRPISIPPAPFEKTVIPGVEVSR